MKPLCEAVLPVSLCLMLSGCASSRPASTSPSNQPTSIQAERESRFVVRVVKRDGKNVISVISGNPDKGSLAIAQAFIDDTVDLKEGEQRDVELDTYRPK